MKSIILVVFVAFFFIPAALPAQTGGNEVVQIVTYWEPGDAHKYSVEIGTEISLETGQSMSFTTYDLLIEVIDHRDETYLVEWTYTDAAPPVGANAFEKRVVDMGIGLSIRFRITDLGEFIGVENWDEIHERVNESIALIRRDFAGEPDIDTSIATLMKAFETKEQFEQSAIEEIKLYHLLHGYSYMMEEPMTVDGETTNPFGGSPVLSTTTIELSQVNKEQSTAYLIYNRFYQRDALARAVFEALNGYLPAGKLTEEQTKDLPELDMQIKKQFIFHTASGWLLEAYSVRQARTNGETRTDSIYIEFLE
jgi:hypothetical protein